MPFLNLRELLAALEKRGELRRVREPASPVLEITEWADRTVKSGGPALLFENVAGSRLPVAINVFGTQARCAFALGVDSLDVFVREIEEILRARPPESLVEKLKMVPLLMKLASFQPRKVSAGPCQEVVHKGDDADLARLPILKCWPQDGGPYITLACVFTRSLAGLPNCGMYRLQVFDRQTLGMHIHVHHDGARMHREYEVQRQRMPVACAIGGDPAVTYAATAPMPPGVDEMLLAGFLRKDAVEMVPCVTQPELYVPAESEIVIEGYLEPGERRLEGPFGDHTGFYSAADQYPVMHVTAITHRKDPIYQTLVVGKPPMEDTFLGKVTERLFLPFVRLSLPEIVDYNFPEFGIFHNCIFVSIRKQYPQHARKVMHGLWGLGQLALEKMIVVVDDDVNVQDTTEVLFHLGAHCDFARDLELVRGPTDILDHATQHPAWGGKLGIDATRKWKEEGVTREWPAPLRMEPVVKAKVAEQLRRLGLG